MKKTTTAPKTAVKIAVNLPVMPGKTPAEIIKAMRKAVEESDKARKALKKGDVFEEAEGVAAFRDILKTLDFVVPMSASETTKRLQNAEGGHEAVRFNYTLIITDAAKEGAKNTAEMLKMVREQYAVAGERHLPTPIYKAYKRLEAWTNRRWDWTTGEDKELVSRAPSGGNGLSDADKAKAKAKKEAEKLDKAKEVLKKAGLSVGIEVDSPSLAEIVKRERENIIAELVKNHMPILVHELEKAGFTLTAIEPAKKPELSEEEKAAKVEAILKGVNARKAKGALVASPAEAPAEAIKTAVNA